MKSRQQALGDKLTLKRIRQGKAQLVILAKCLAQGKTEIEHYGTAARTGVLQGRGNNPELGTGCGKYYTSVHTAVTEPVDPDAIRSVPGQPGKKK